MIVAALSVTMVFLFLNTSSELAPEEDIGFMFSIVNAPAYATSDYTEMFVKQVVDATKDIPEIDTRFSVVGFGGTNTAFAGFGLVPWADRSRSQATVQQEVQNKLNGVAGVQAFVFAPPTLPGTGGGLPVQFVIRSTGDADQVYEVAEEIKDRAQKSGRFIIVQDSLSFTQPQARVTIDRDRAAALGVAISEIGATLTALVGGGSVSKFDRESRSYDVITQVAQKDRFNPGKPRQLLRPQRLRRHGSALRGDHRQDAGRAGRDRAVQPAELGDDLRPAASGRRDRRRARRRCARSPAR